MVTFKRIELVNTQCVDPVGLRHTFFGCSSAMYCAQEIMQIFAYKQEFSIDKNLVLRFVVALSVGKAPVLVVCCGMEDLALDLPP